MNGHPYLNLSDLVTKILDERNDNNTSKQANAVEKSQGLGLKNGIVLGMENAINNSCSKDGLSETLEV